jgi:hypothetical protein
MKKTFRFSSTLVANQLAAQRHVVERWKQLAHQKVAGDPLESLDFSLSQL